MHSTWETAAEYFQRDVRSLPEQPRGAYGITNHIARIAYNYPAHDPLWLQSLQAEAVKDVVRSYYWYSVGGDRLPVGVDYCASHLALACDNSFFISRWMVDKLGTTTSEELYRATSRLGKAECEALITHLVQMFIKRMKLHKQWSVKYQAWLHLARRIEKRAVKMVRENG